MKKTLKVLAAIVVIVPLLAFGWLTYSTQKNLATPGDDALAALITDDTVQVETGEWLVMKPVNVPPKAGIILYPGANCDIRGYGQLLRALATEGYLVVAVSMPFDFAIFAPDRADEVRTAFPDIDQWVIAGHSMGGAMAGRYAFFHEDDLAGLILWDSYAPEANSLADSKLPLLHVHRATPDGTPPQKFQDMSHVYPPQTRWVPVPGGQHMYFGSFIGGGYTEEWGPETTPEVQRTIAIAAMVEWLADIVG